MSRHAYMAARWISLLGSMAVWLGFVVICYQSYPARVVVISGGFMALTAGICGFIWGMAVGAKAEREGD